MTLYRVIEYLTVVVDAYAYIYIYTVDRDDLPSDVIYHVLWRVVATFFSRRSARQEYTYARV